MELGNNLVTIKDDVVSDLKLGYDVASDTYKSILVLKKIEKVRSQLSPEEQEYFDQYLFELQQAQDPLKSNAAPAVAGVAAIGAAELTVLVAGTGVAACSATKACSDTVEDGLKDTQKAARKTTYAIIDYTVGIFSSDKKKSENKANNAPPQTSQVASTPPPDPPPERKKSDELSQNERKVISTNSEIIAKGSRIRKVDELVQKFGGRAKDWVKKKGRDSSGQEWHWYENNGKKVGWKRAGEHDPF